MSSTVEPIAPLDTLDAATFTEVCNDIAGHLNTQMGRLVDLTIWLLDADNTRHWSGDGVWKPQQYLAWRCGIGPALANNLVTAAQRARDLPASIDA